MGGPILVKEREGHNRIDQGTRGWHQNGLNPTAMGFEPHSDSSDQFSDAAEANGTSTYTQMEIKKLTERLFQVEVTTARELKNIRQNIEALEARHLCKDSYGNLAEPGQDHKLLGKAYSNSVKDSPNVQTARKRSEVPQENNEDSDENGVEPHSRDSVSPDITVDAEQVWPTVEDPARPIAMAQPPWQPLAIRRLNQVLSDLPSRIPPTAGTRTFSSDFLHATFQGVEWSPGLYYVPRAFSQNLLPGRTYYLLDARVEPYLPLKPGMHGAKLTAFFNTNVSDDNDDEDDTAAYTRVPLFVSVERYAKGQPTTTKAGKDRSSDRYIYYGSYSQLRWSDKLDYDRMVEHVPYDVKMHWAEKLSAADRPEWVTEALMQHFWPKPELEAPMSSYRSANGSALTQESAEDNQEFLKSLEQYAELLKEWEVDARHRVGFLRKEDILAAFENEDAGNPPGLRLWWEYLQCEDWDRELHQKLLAGQADYERLK